MDTKKAIKILIYIEILIFLSIILKLVLNFTGFNMLFVLRFGIIFSLPFQLLCLTIVGLILGIIIQKNRSSKKVFIVFCSILIVILLFFFFLNLTFSNCKNSKEFVRITVPNSNKIAVLNSDGAVPGWIGYDTGLVCYIQVNKFFLKEIKARGFTGGYELDRTFWRRYQDIKEAYKMGNFRWEEYALIIELEYNDNVVYDFSAYIKSK